MTAFRRLAASVLAGTAIAAASLAPAAAAAPILVKSCAIAKPKPFSHLANGTNVSYVLLGQKTASSVTFVVGYRNALHNYVRRVTDVGTFSPGSTIDHRLSLYNDVTYAGSQTTLCAPVSVKWADSTVWIAPSRP